MMTGFSGFRIVVLTAFFLTAALSGLAVAEEEVVSKLDAAVKDYGEQNFKEVKAAMETYAAGEDISPDQRFNARYMMAFCSYHIKLEEAEKLFGELAEEIKQLTPEELEKVNDFINTSYETVWLDIFRKIHKFNDTVIARLASTFRNRATIYHIVEALKPVISITDDMSLIVENRPDNDEYRKSYEEIQELQKELAEKEGLGAGAKK